MYENQVIYLTKFMPESLHIPTNMTTPARQIQLIQKNYYEDFIKQDPQKTLNLVGFSPQPHVSVKGSEIQEFYRNTNIFITGGSGFLGKVLIEKLFRSLPNIKHVYLLIRPKRGKSAKERFDQLMEDQVFLRMQTEVPQYLSKITVVEGDISEPGLGLSTEDRQMLIEKINVVFNSAADVRFLEPLKNAIASNVLGTKKILELCKEMHELKAFVHVSTAYSHCVRSFIEEKIYRVHTNYKDVLISLENIPESEIESTTKRIIQDWPNTYTFSKALSEQMIEDEKEHLPLCIVRPSIVLPTYKEPVRGWCDNLYGPMGLTVGVGLGVLHCGPTDLETPADFVPVDYVANFLLATAWKTASQIQNKTVTVYNFTATSVRPTSWKDFINFLLCIKDTWPFNQAIWYTSYMNTNINIYDLAHLVIHSIPGIMLDKVLVMMGKQARLSKVYSKVYATKEQTAYFTGRVWRWQSDNVWKFWNEMSEVDRQLFGFDLASIDFKEHLLVCKLGTKHFLLKDKLENLSASIKNNNKLYWLHKALQLMFGFTALKMMAIISHHLPI